MAQGELNLKMMQDQYLQGQGCIHSVRRTAAESQQQNQQQQQNNSSWGSCRFPDFLKEICCCLQEREILRNLSLLRSYLAWSWTGQDAR
jgi:hypothetical protein